MQTDNVLITITTAANMGGIEQAKAGLLGLTAPTLALTLATTGAVMAGKSMVEIAEKQQKAHKELAQAVEATGGSITSADAYLQDFIDHNRAYLSDQAEVTAGYAALLRSGIPVAEAQKDMNRALDLAALKNRTVGEAVDLLIAAEHGRTKGLIDLGITTSKYTDAEGNVINQGKNMALVMAEIDAKTKNGKNSFTDLQKATNELGNNWQTFVSDSGGGGALIGAFTTAVDLVNLLDTFMTKSDFGKGFKQGFDLNVKPGMDALEHLYQLALGVIDGGGLPIPGKSPGKPPGPFNYDPNPAVQVPGGSSSYGPLMDSGGTVPGAAGSLQPVMARGGEEYLGYGSGRRSSGGTTVYIQIGTWMGDGPSIDRLANEVARRLTYATGR